MKKQTIPSEFFPVGKKHHGILTDTQHDILAREVEYHLMSRDDARPLSLPGAIKATKDIIKAGKAFQLALKDENAQPTAAQLGHADQVGEMLKFWRAWLKAQEYTLSHCGPDKGGRRGEHDRLSPLIVSLNRLYYAVTGRKRGYKPYLRDSLNCLGYNFTLASLTKVLERWDIKFEKSEERTFTISPEGVPEINRRNP